MRRPTLARLYRSYISELVAIMNSDPDCREVSIVGDAVWCVVNTPNKSDIKDVFRPRPTRSSRSSTTSCASERFRRSGVGSGWTTAGR
jgi:hypothetical protein